MILNKFLDEGDLVKVWKKADEINLTPQEMNRLFNWLSGSVNSANNVLGAFIHHTNLVEVWKIVDGNANLNLNIFSNFPPHTNGFYNKFFEVFRPGDELLGKTGNFLGDVQGSSDNLLGLFSTTPQKIDAWDILHRNGKNRRA